jgi:hypothetical protein
MDYLTNYYKNLCEQLQNKINFLNHSLNENIQPTRFIAPEEAGDSDAFTNNMEIVQNAPQAGNRAPKIKEPKKPVKREYPYENESDADFAKRWSDYQKALRAHERYKAECPSGCDNTWLFPNPEHPRGIQGAKPGDVFIDGNGVIYRRNNSGDWVKQ